MKKLSEYIARLIDQSGKKPAQLARMVGMSRQQLSNYQRGVYDLSWEKLQVLANAVGLQTKVIFTQIKEQKSMQVEHISALTHNVVLRETNTIADETRAFFAPIVASALAGNIEHIPETPFRLKVSKEGDVALFDVMKGNDIISVNVCCLSKEGVEAALNTVRDLQVKIPFFGRATKKPGSAEFIFSFPLPLAGTPEDYILAGEIELYIYFEIFKIHHNGKI